MRRRGVAQAKRAYGHDEDRTCDYFELNELVGGRHRRIKFWVGRRKAARCQRMADSVEKGRCCDSGIPVIQSVLLAGLKIMMGHRQVEPAALFYEFSLERHISVALRNRSGQLTICAALSGHDG
jgi:hypothetical protein